MHRIEPTHSKDPHRRRLDSTAAVTQSTLSLPAALWVLNYLKSADLVIISGSFDIH
jgi:hypothetical protein